MEISKAAETLLEALASAAGGRVRIEIDTIRAAFLSAFPQWQGSADRRERLSTLLAELATAERVRLPGDRRQGWEQAPAPPLPRWLMLLREAAPAETSFDHRNFPWVLELSFVASLRTVLNPEELRLIHDFLKDCPERRPIVPVKERSFQLFGNEKRLDSLRKTKLFDPGRLTLELLRCRDVPASLPSVPAPRPSEGEWLIVENEATFHSFARMNRALALHAGVALGSGRNVLRAVDFLLTLSGTNTHPHAAGFVYFGDIDRDGIEIPLELDRRLRQRGPFGVSPAMRYYEWLFSTRFGIAQTVADPASTLAALQWFPEDFRGGVCSALQGKPLVQEAIGWEFLTINLGLNSDLSF